MTKCLTVAALALALFLADAGGYGKNRQNKKKLVKDDWHKKYYAATLQGVPVKPIESLPKNWDWCHLEGSTAPSCVASWNQHIPTYCGSCYVHGTLATINDRIKIANRGKNVPDVMLGRQTFLNCGESRGFGTGCGGGEEEDILQYMHEYGLPDETCNNYRAKEFGKCDAAAECMNCMMFDGDDLGHCWPVRNFTKYYVSSFGYVSGEAAMMSEIHARGPITCGMAATDDFCFAYQSGVWPNVRNVTDEEVDHDVEVVGWGEDQGVKYWKIRNSWGTYWGEMGFFRLLRGENALRIEDRCASALVDVHELDARLKNDVVGSMYGPLSPGEPVHLYPATWNKEPHKWTAGALFVKDPERSSILPGGKHVTLPEASQHHHHVPSDHHQAVELAVAAAVGAAPDRLPTIWLGVCLGVAFSATAFLLAKRCSFKSGEYEPLK